MKPHALVPYPMTPPDDPPEPSLEGAVPCPQCQYPPDWQKGVVGPHANEWRLYCDQGHLDGSWERTLDKAIEYWNTECETVKGENLKAEGVATVAEHNEAWMQAALYLIGAIAATGTEFTVQDVRSHKGYQIPPPKSPNAWGAAFSVATKQGLIERVGYQKNRLASAHARTVSVWKGVSK